MKGASSLSEDICFFLSPASRFPEFFDKDVSIDGPSSPSVTLTPLL